MIFVKVYIAKSVNELSCFQAADLRHHHGEQGIGGDVERHAEEDIGRALVQLAGEFAIGHVKLEEGVAGAERHLGQLSHIPGADEDAAGVGIVFDGLYSLCDLIDGAVGAFPGDPLFAVDGAEVAVFVGPFVPDAHAVFLQIAHIGVAFEEPEQLVDDAFQVQLFGGYERKAFAEIKAHLVSKAGDRARTGAVIFFDALFEYVAHEVEVLLHSGNGFSMPQKYAFFPALPNAIS